MKVSALKVEKNKSLESIQEKKNLRARTPESQLKYQPDSKSTSQQTTNYNSFSGINASTSSISNGSINGLNQTGFPRYVRNKKVENPYLDVSPLKNIRPQGRLGETAGQVFLDYVHGQLSGEELLYIKNFPGLYSSFPEPKRAYLKLYMRESKGQPPDKETLLLIEDKDSIKTNEDLDDYQEDEELDRNLRSSSKSGGGPLPLKKEQKSVAFSSETKFLESKRKSVVMDKMASFQNVRLASIKCYHEQVAELQQRNDRKQNISKSLSTLKKIISNNITLRKKSSGFSSFEGSSLLQNLSGIESNYKQRIENKDLNSSDTNNSINNKGIEVKKALKNLSIITQKIEETPSQKEEVLKDEYKIRRALYKRYFQSNADQFIKVLQYPYDQRIQDRIQKSNLEYNKFVHSYLSKSTLAQQKETDTNNHNITGGLKQKGYENQFVFEGRDLLEIKEEQNAFSRSLIQQIGDLDNYGQNHMAVSIDKLSQGIKIPPPKNTFFPKSRFMQVRKSENKITKMSHSSNKILFLNGHNTPNNTTLPIAGINTSIQSQSGGVKTMSNLEYQQSPSQQQLIIKTQNQQQQQQQLGQQLIKLQGQTPQSQSKIPSALPSYQQIQLIFPNAPIQQKNISSPQNNNFLLNSTPNSLSPPLQQQPHHPQQQQQQQQVLEKQIQSSSQQQQQLQLLSNQQQQGIPPQQQQISQQLQDPVNAQKMKVQKKLETQLKKGYHLIRRNQSEHVNNKQNEDLIHDESDDSSNASMTETNLDLLYSESISIQNKMLKEQSSEGLIKRLKQMIKLENIKKDVLDTNLYKLDKKRGN